ncbi:type 1 fimbria pilin [Luteibacter sp. Sphag1AF]|uniref:fimbrial protein n=1 Tax=Luteibacter sp. Sphag1AF TaxID=2587031 RepID=UPI00161B925A|nr:fimbrial protein [Luteibacter sp. Sphag1AF]MBB3227641.1 type 1 fimbria pilin [Luteibacter sp. Sphag1AF]
MTDRLYCWIALLLPIVGAVHAQTITPLLPDASESVNLWVEGRIVGGCEFEASSLNVPMGHIRASALPAVGAAGPWVDLAFQAKACQAVNRITMSFDAEPDADSAEHFSLDEPLRGLAIELQTAAGDIVVPRHPQPLVFDPLPANGRYAFRARYKRLRDLSAGEANATVTVRMTFD